MGSGVKWLRRGVIVHNAQVVHGVPGSNTVEVHLTPASVYESFMKQEAVWTQDISTQKSLSAEDNSLISIWQTKDIQGENVPSSYVSFGVNCSFNAFCSCHVLFLSVLSLPETSWHSNVIHCSLPQSPALQQRHLLRRLLALPSCQSKPQATQDTRPLCAAVDLWLCLLLLVSCLCFRRIHPRCRSLPIKPLHLAGTGTVCVE